LQTVAHINQCILDRPILIIGKPYSKSASFGIGFTHSRYN
jgi:hypothetical protein